MIAHARLGHEQCEWCAISAQFIALMLLLLLVNESDGAYRFTEGSPASLPRAVNASSFHVPGPSMGARTLRLRCCRRRLGSGDRSKRTVAAGAASAHMLRGHGVGLAAVEAGGRFVPAVVDRDL